MIDQNKHYEGILTIIEAHLIACGIEKKLLWKYMPKTLARAICVEITPIPTEGVPVLIATETKEEPRGIFGILKRLSNYRYDP